MTINKDVTVREIQSNFVDAYPHLDIRFYKKPHQEFHGSQKADEVTENELLGRLNPNIQNGQIDISQDVTVAELETAFEEAFGLHVQIFRKSGDTWLQTSVTDHWTLKHHQENAMEMEKYSSNRNVV